MTSIGEHAKEYEPQRMKNIADLEVVSVTQQLVEDTRETQDKEEYSVNFIQIAGEEYRVPNSVLDQLKTMLKEKPDMKSFKVVKEGEGKGTKYTVVPLD